MGLYTYDSSDIPKSERITKLVEDLYAKMPEIESAAGGSDHGILSPDRGRADHHPACESICAHS